MKIIDHHCTDYPGSKTTKRIIKNWQNYKTPSGLWCASLNKPNKHDTPPLDWDGTWDFSHANTTSPLQSFFCDKKDQSNKAMWGVRLSDKPQHWVNFKLHNASAQEPEVMDNKLLWKDVFYNTDLELSTAWHKIEKNIILKGPGHPTEFIFTISCHNQTTVTINNGIINFIDAKGHTWLQSRQVWGTDAEQKPVSVVLENNGEIDVKNKKLKSVIIRVALDENVVYPVTIDPTVALTGASAIEDTYITNFASSNNFGASLYCVTAGNGSYYYRTLLRIKTNVIPAHTISAATLNVYRFPASSYTQPGTAYYYMVSAANTWVVGTAQNALQVGSCCRSYAIYNTQIWAGGTGGCGTSGTDYIADASPPSIPFLAFTSGTDTLFSVSIKEDWFNGWRTGSYTNNGFIMRLTTDEATVGSVFAFRSNEFSSNHPYIELTYESTTQSFITFRCPL